MNEKIVGGTVTSLRNFFAKKNFWIKKIQKKIRNKKESKIQKIKKNFKKLKKKLKKFKKT